MRLEQSGRTAVSSGVEGSTQFEISGRNSAHIMTILRDTLYSDRVLAVLREYGSNAWDAHRVSGKADVPIEVKLPTQLDPELCIRDHGPGLSTEEMFQVYTQYGESTKRDSDDFVGMLGIGSKSGFAYSDTFTVTSWKDGHKSIYVAALDESGKGRLDMLLQEPCDPSESGLEVKIAVRREDIDEFKERAGRLFPFFTPLPKMNVPVADPFEGGTDVDGIARIKRSGYGGRDWWALMGCVAYKIDFSQLDRSLPHFIQYFSGVIRVPIGTVHVSASREGLKYSDLTRKTISELIQRVGERYTEMCIEALDNPGTDKWTRLKLLTSMREVGLKPPAQFDSEKFPRLELDATKHLFHFDKMAEKRMSYFNADTNVVIKDDTRSLRGFDLYDSRDILIVPRKGQLLSKVRADVTLFFDSLGLGGIPITLLSSRPWKDYTSHKRRAASPQHKARMFSYCGKEQSPLSKSWDPVDRNPDPDDVYVEIDRFEVEGYDFYSQYERDKVALLATGTSIKMPTVYGYKPKKVGDPARKGISYQQWRKKTIAELRKDPDLMAMARAQRLRVVLNDFRSADDQRVAAAINSLGESHFISKLLIAIRDSFSVKLHSYSWSLNAFILEGEPGGEDSLEERQVMRTIEERYPLAGGLRDIVFGYRANHCIEYIRAMDNMKQTGEDKQ